jgi:hypothetical protein
MFGASMKNRIDRQVAPILSHRIFGGPDSVRQNSLRRERIQSNSAAVLATDLYSTSVEDLETVGYLRELHEIKLEPR